MEDQRNVERSDRSTTTDDASNLHAPTGSTTRRRYLAGAAAFGVLGAAGAFSAPAAATGTFADLLSQYSDRFSTIIDVTEAGADNTGSQSITPVLRNLADDDTLLVFPPGTYYMDSQFRFSGFTNFGLLGNEATILPAPIPDYDGPQYRLFRLGVPYNPGRDLLVRGFTVDQTANNTGVRVVEAIVHDGLEVRDIWVKGQHDGGCFGPGFFSVTDPDGSGIVERFRAPAGGAWVTLTPNPMDMWRGPTGILLSKLHKGTIELRDCVLGGFPDNGLYGVTDGTVRVIGGRYKNSNAASIRLAGTDCLIQGTKVAVDRQPYNFANQRGIRLDAGSGFRVENVTIDLPKPNGHALAVQDGVTSARIENVDVTIGDRVNHGIVISPNAGPTDIVGTSIEIDGGGNAIRILGTDAGKVTVEGTDITGDASGKTFRHAIRCERNGCELRGVTVQQPGTHLRRAAVLNGDDCLIYKSQFHSTHHPVIVNGAGAWLEANYLESYNKYQAVRLNKNSSRATLKHNTLVHGVLDLGCDGLRMYGNDVIA